MDEALKQAVNFLVGKVKSLLGVAAGGATPLATKVPFQFEGANYLIWAVGTSSGARIMWSQADSTATNVLDDKVVQNNTTLTGDLNKCHQCCAEAADRSIDSEARSVGDGAGRWPGSSRRCWGC